jgi:hypothetical protein
MFTFFKPMTCRLEISVVNPTLTSKLLVATKFLMRGQITSLIRLPPNSTKSLHYMLSSLVRHLSKLKFGTSMIYLAMT